jgi:glutamate racemase
MVVLACTHFPLLEDELREAFPGICYVDGGPGIARRIAYLTQAEPWPAEAPAGVAIFTGPSLESLLPALATYGVTEVKTL